MQFDQRFEIGPDYSYAARAVCSRRSHSSKRLAIRQRPPPEKVLSNKQEETWRSETGALARLMSVLADIDRPRFPGRFAATANTDGPASREGSRTAWIAEGWALGAGRFRGGLTQAAQPVVIRDHAVPAPAASFAT